MIMKAILAVFFASVCVSGSLQALFFESAQDQARKNDITERIQGTFESLIQENERAQWKRLEDFYITKEGGCGSWIPVKENNASYVEKISILFSYKPNEIEKRQYRDIDEAFECYKKNHRFNKIEWKFEKINDLEAIIEQDEENGLNRTIERAIMVGDWVIRVKYKNRPRNNLKNMEIWEAKREFWLDQFKNLKFS